MNSKSIEEKIMTRDDDYRRSDYSGDTIRFLTAGFGMGLLVGAALGILLAPKSGRETREQLKEFATEMGDRAKTAAGTIGEHATATYGQVSESAKTAADRAGETAQQVKTTVSETASTVKDVTGRVTRAAKKGYKKTMDELQAVEEGEETE